jgi:NDP-sugar pyrophosphorylase family protein
MKAMIFAAGLGTRLLPLTSDRPKALVELNGITLLEMVISRLRDAGVTEIIINVHYLAGMIVDFIRSRRFPGVDLYISDESELLLDTGGGLKKAAWFFDDGRPFFVHNVDVLTSLDLKKMYASHAASGALASLAVMDRDTARHFLFDDTGTLCGWQNSLSGETCITRKGTSTAGKLAFSGIQVLNPGFPDRITEKGAFSIRDVYLRLAEHHTIKAFRHDGDAWFDLGKKENLVKAAEYLRKC